LAPLIDKANQLKYSEIELNNWFDLGVMALAAISAFWRWRWEGHGF
jgi:hypothetical protein